jgi:DNA-binding winged helix-turn-helix (wHTH) protein/tetratricopeptide (TPR) repeat protein
MDDTNRIPVPSSVATYRFGLFTLNVAAGLLTRNGVRVKLQDQPFQLLALLVERSGETVTREEIRQRLWQGNTFVDFDKSLGVAVLKVREALGDSASNPRFIETLPRRGYRLIAPVSVEIVPVRSDAATSVAMLDVAPDEPTLPVPVSPAPDPLLQAHLEKPEGKKIWYVAAALCVLLALAFAVFRIQLVPKPSVASPPASPPTMKLRRSVAVLGFRNVSGGPDQNWLSTAFTEMLNTELAANGDLRMVSGEDVASVKHDLSLPAEDTLGKGTLARLRSNLEADVVVVGSYTLLGDGGKNRLRLDIRAQDTALGETIYEGAITGNEDDLFDLASQAGSRIRERLNPSTGSALVTEATRFPGSSNQLAVQLYSEGRARIYQFDFIGARDFLKRAVTADPDFALAHSALSSAMNSLGYKAQGRVEAQRALQHSRGLGQESALVIQGQYQESISDWQNAAVTYRKLADLFPDNLTYGLRLAAMESHTNPEDAVHTLASLRTLPAPVGDDPRIDLMEASVLISQNLPKARAAAQKAIAKASAQGATLMIARGYGILCQQDFSLGVALDESVSECNLARNSSISAGDGNNAARTLNDLAGLYFQHGDLDKAESMWKEAIVVFRKAGDTEGIAASSNNVGGVLLARGKLAEAQKMLEQAVAGYRLTGDRSGMALALVDLGEIAVSQANLPAANTDYEQSVALGHGAGDNSAVAYGLSGLGDVLAEQDQLPAARKEYENALKLRQDIGENQTILETRTSLARLSLEEGHAREAESQIRQCRDQLRQQQFLDDELEADLVLVDALLEQSKVEDAKREVLALHPLEVKTQQFELQLRSSLELARTFAADHDLRSSRRLLETASREAEASGYARLAWETQTALASVEGKAGDIAGAIERLKKLEASERKAGLVMQVRKTRTAAKLLAARDN